MVTHPPLLQGYNHPVCLNSCQTTETERETPGWGICEEEKGLTSLPATRVVLQDWFLQHWSGQWPPLNMRNSSAIPSFPDSIHDSYSSESGGASPTCLREKQYLPFSVAWKTDASPKHWGCGHVRDLLVFLKVYEFLSTYIVSESFYFFQGNKRFAFPVHLEHATSRPKPTHLCPSKQCV